MNRIFLLVILFIFPLQGFAQYENIEKINCDSIFNKKGYFATIKYNATDENWDESKPNILFTFSQMVHGKEVIIHSEKLFSQFKHIEFIDFNGDGVKDILVENISDVRSNLTYNLFLVNLKKNRLDKVAGFNEIKNPNYLEKYDLVDCLVMSGRNWTRFYKITENKVKDFGYSIKMGEDENGKDFEYDKNYDRILKKILKSEKNRWNL